jgi:hypothetical protein
MRAIGTLWYVTYCMKSAMQLMRRVQRPALQKLSVFMVTGQNLDGQNLDSQNLDSQNLNSQYREPIVVEIP